MKTWPLMLRYAYNPKAEVTSTLLNMVQHVLEILTGSVHHRSRVSSSPPGASDIVEEVKASAKFVVIISPKILSYTLSKRLVPG